MSSFFSSSDLRSAFFHHQIYLQGFRAHFSGSSLNPSNAMNTLNPTADKLSCRHTQLIASLSHHRPFSPKPSFSRSFRFPPPPLPQLSLSLIRASLQDTNHETPDEILKLFNRQITDKSAIPVPSSAPLLKPLRAYVVSDITAAALIFSGFYFSIKPSLATPLSPPPTVETAERDSALDEEREKLLEQHLLSNPNDVVQLRDLMEIKIKNEKIPEAIQIVEKLMELEPEEIELPMLRAHLYAHHGKFELARNEFHELFRKILSLKNIERKIEETIRLCGKKTKKSDFREFKLLLAQIKVIEGRFDEDLRNYEELVKEEPRDFRPNLCQGIIYSFLRKNNEAEKNFEKFRRLIPRGHPLMSYFDDNRIATKIFGQKVENETPMSKT
ncbi:hypothetical protein OROGR_017566 [Orobanche gracilis]